MLIITSLECTESTNTYLLNLINRKKIVENQQILIDIPEFYTVSAGFQSSGRGHKDNSWISEPEKNILLSTLIYPSVSAENQFLINMSISLGILEFCKGIIDSEDLSIKWPNDIYYKDKKLGGVLIEHTIIGDSILFSIVGIGLNINQSVFPESLPNPVSIFQINQKEYNINQCIRNLLDTIIRKYNNGVFDEKSIRNEYLGALYRYGEPHAFLYKGTQIEASIIDISKHGMLCLKTSENEIIECGFKEIGYVIQSDPTLQLTQEIE